MSPSIHLLLQIVAFLGLLLLLMVLTLVLTLLVLFIVGGILQWRENRNKDDIDKGELNEVRASHQNVRKIRH